MPRRKTSQAPLELTMPNDIQLVGFEKNLDIMGFFIADEFRGKSEERPTERLIEYSLTRNGRPYLLRYTLKSTSSGLPNSTDKDVWNAVQSIIYRQKKDTGFIANPICFTARQTLDEMGVASNGANYKKINDCFTRFKETTITSADVVYNAIRKKYNEKHFSVFSRWEKAGASDLDGSDRNEFYQIWLDQIVLDNINIGYVQLEDFAAYKQLTRPAAKVLIGNLYFWFGAADGPYVARDYRDLCNLLGITCYKYKSRIKDKLGPSLNELIDIGYLTKWDVQPMSTKAVGFKICMWAGPEMVRVINAVKATKGQRSKALPSAIQARAELTDDQSDAMKALIGHGVAQTKARELALCHKPEDIQDQIEYGRIFIEDDTSGRRKLDNPPGYLIWRIAENVPIPASFYADRKHEKETRAQREQSEKQQAESLREACLQAEYAQWKDRQIDAELQTRFANQNIETKLDELESHIRKDKAFRNWSQKARRDQAMQMLRRDVAAEFMLPNFDEWLSDHPQSELF